MKKLIYLNLSLTLLTIGALHSQAQVITGDTGTQVTGNGIIAPGDATDYQFYAVNDSNSATLGTPENFTLDPLGSGYSPGAGGGATTTLEAPGSTTSFQTGLIYGPGNSTSTLLKFTLTNPAESDFNVYVLTQNNASGANGDASVTLSAGSGANQSATVDPSIPDNGSTGNDFVEFHVTGATTAQTFSVSATGTGDYIGGITFADTTPAASTPEPATWALVLGGFAALLGFHKFRRNA
jgi:hypothetical protein